MREEQNVKCRFSSTERDMLVPAINTNRSHPTALPHPCGDPNPPSLTPPPTPVYLRGALHRLLLLAEADRVVQLRLVVGVQLLQPGGHDGRRAVAHHDLVVVAVGVGVRHQPRPPAGRRACPPRHRRRLQRELDTTQTHHWTTSQMCADILLSRENCLNLSSNRSREWIVPVGATSQTSPKDAQYITSSLKSTRSPDVLRNGTELLQLHPDNIFFNSSLL